MRMKIVFVFCCLLYAAWVKGASIIVKGLEGGEVSFQCSHKLAWKNSKYLCKDQCEGSKDTLVTVKSGHRAESGRITLVDSGNSDFTVTFRLLKLSDAGTYWCAVDRPGFDTFTEVHLIVEEATTNETTLQPEFSPTWTYQHVSNSTQSGMDVSRLTNLSTASNYTNVGEQSISTGTVWYATIGAVSILLTTLVLATCFKKHRKNSKAKPQACSSSAGCIGADKRKDIGEKVQSMKKSSQSVSCVHRQKRDPPTSVSTAGDCSVPDHIYENISRSTANSKYSHANAQDDHDTRIYIKPLPDVVSERTGPGSFGKRTDKPAASRNATSKPTGSRTRNESDSRSHSDSKERKPGSLWFGLDVTGTV